jgi:phosphoenolpyruvate carboxylase
VLTGQLARGLSQKDAAMELGLGTNAFRGLCVKQNMPRWNAAYVRNETAHAAVQAARAAGAPISKSVKVQEHIKRKKRRQKPNFISKGLLERVSVSKDAFDALYPKGFHSCHADLPPLAVEVVLEHDRLRLLHATMLAASSVRPPWY